MKTRSLTVHVPADRDVVFAFLAQLESLPEWAPGLCTGLRRDGAHWRALTLIGEGYFTVAADARTGVIDLFVGAQPDEMMLLPLRVVRQPHGSAITCTVFQPTDWAEELFEQLYATMLIALRGLPARFGGGEIQAPSGEGHPFFPGLVTARFFESWDFYTEQLGFRTLCECDFYVQLVHPCGAQIALLRHELDGPTPELVSATDGRGFWLNLDVADADAEHARLSAAGVTVVSPPQDKPWGDRQFIVRDPNGVLISIAHRQEVRGTESRPLAAN